MTPTWKRGATVQILLDQFTPEEWAAIHPWDAVRAAAQQGMVTHVVTVTADPVARTILLSADSSGWLLRLASIDLRIERAGVTAYVPGASALRINIIAPVTTEPA